MTITFSNNSIKAIECQNCTTDFINQILPLLSYQSATHVIICNDIGHYQPLPPCLPELIPRMEKLFTLTLENILDTSLIELIPALSRVPTLWNLRIESDTGKLLIEHKTKSLSTISGTPKLVSMFLPQLPQQTHIRWNLSLHKLNSEDTTLLYQWLPACQLETLTLHSLSHDHSVMLCKTLTSVSSLKTLDIQESDLITFQSVQAFAYMLQQNQSLTKLVLTSCTINSDSAHYLAEALYHNTTLKRLVMLGNPVGDRVALAMAEMLKHNTTLEELNFIGAKFFNISSDGACCLAEALHHNTTLKKLDMNRNSVGERGALAMAKMLQHNTTLEELDLRESPYNFGANTIGNNGIKALAESLVENKNLKKLIISEQYRNCVKFLPDYHRVKGRVKLRW